MSNPFDAPPEGAIPTQSERALSVRYKANKTPKQYANMATDQTLQEAVLKSALGFGYYDKDEKQNVPMPEMAFVVLEIYAGVSGYDGESVSFWSNRAKDTRTEPLTVWASNHQGPILKGLYSEIKPQLPAGAKYAKFVKAYSMTLDRVIEIELTGAAERGMQKAIAAHDAKGGKWEKVFILGLAQNDHLWGFALQGYNRTTKDGYEYKGEGDLFFEPKFYAGIVNPMKSEDLHGKCVALQSEERALHASYKVRNSNESVEQSNKGNDDFPTQENAPPPIETDDLPF